MSESIYPIISRKEAKAQGLKYYFTGKPCKIGHLTERYTTSSGCVECSNYSYINNKENISKNNKHRYNDDKESKLSKNNKYYINNKFRYTTYNKRCRNKEGSKEKASLYERIKRSTDPLYKMRCNIRVLIGNSMTKGGFKKSSKTASILGCSFEEFKIHIENQFTEGMIWDNYGEWQYDHIYPVSLARDEAHLIELNHYTNFQPLWEADNRKKGNKII